jgi:hypothetical protein
MRTKSNNTEMVAAAPEAVETAKSADRIKEEWLAIRSEAVRQINPETAEVEWEYGQILDPYGIDPELPEERRQVGRNYSLDPPEATHGFPFTIYPPLPAMPCGKNIKQVWRFLQASRV